MKEIIISVLKLCVKSVFSVFWSKAKKIKYMCFMLHKNKDMLH